MDFTHPVKILKISSGYGLREDPFTGKMSYHAGLDYSIPIGTSVLPSLNGTVEKIENTPSYGLKIILDHGSGIKTLYAHLEKVLVNIGDYVTQDTVMALSGNSGRSTAPHLHFQIFINSKSIDPKKYLKLPTKTNQPNKPNIFPLIIISGILFYLYK